MQVLTHLKLGIHYGKCSIDAYGIYLETPTTDGHAFYDYTYYIWTKDETNEVWISIFEFGECIFVGQPSNLIDKYKEK